MGAIYKEARERRQRGEDVVVDHMVPIVCDLVCGLHWEYNLQIITSAENYMKSNKLWPGMWYEQYSLLLEYIEHYQYELPL